MATDVFLKVQTRVDEVRARYRDSASSWVNILAYGDFGTGKTSLAATCPTPVFIDSFDPGGTKTAVLQPLIEKGDIIVENKWERDTWKDPYAYREWETEMEMRRRDDFFEHIGTYILDSATKWSDSIMFAILRNEGRKGKTPQIQDYLIQQLTAIDWLNIIMGFPCHCIVTGHIGYDKDEVTGKIETGLLMYGKLSAKVPLVFDEKYISTIVATAKEPVYKLQTRNDGYKKAETRMGGLKFDLHEDPDIRALMRKAGVSADNKPALIPPPLYSTES